MPIRVSYRTSLFAAGMQFEPPFPRKFEMADGIANATSERN